MPVVDAKCPNCSGAIQLDDSKTTGYCMHCGSQLEVKEAIQKVKLEGNVQVEGIATLNSMVLNGIQLIKLDEYQEAEKVFEKITKEHPSDYRGWFYLAFLRSQKFKLDDKSDEINRLIKNAIRTAKPEVEDDLLFIQKKYNDFCENHMAYRHKMGEINKKKNSLVDKGRSIQKDISDFKNEYGNLKIKLRKHKKTYLKLIHLRGLAFSVLPFGLVILFIFLKNETADLQRNFQRVHEDFLPSLLLFPFIFLVIFFILKIRLSIKGHKNILSKKKRKEYKSIIAKEGKYVNKEGKYLNPRLLNEKQENEAHVKNFDAEMIHKKEKWTKYKNAVFSEMDDVVDKYLA